MSNKKLVTLGLVAVLMIIWATIMAQIAGKPFTPARHENAPLIQGLDPSNIAAITVGTDPNALTLSRKGNHFVVSSKQGYPAENGRINELVTGVLDVKTTELVTSNPENHADLEVSADKAKSLVKFLDKNGQLITGVAIGKRAESGGSYVRLLSSDDVYLSSNTPWIRSAANDYIDQQLINVSGDDVQNITVTDPNGSYTLKSEPNSTKITLENMPEDKKLKDDHKQVFSALTNLRFDDVMTVSSAPENPKFDRTYVCQLQNSTVYTLSIAIKDEKTFAKCQAKFTGNQEVTKENKVESQEQLKKKEAILLALEAVGEFNLRHKNWVYQLPDWKAKNLTKKLSELLEDQQKPEDTEQASTDPNADSAKTQ